MKIKEFIAQIEERVSLDLQEDWDHSGKQVGNFEHELTGVILSLDLSNEAIDAAIASGANLIVNHHPLFMEPIEDLAFVGPKMEKITRAIKNDICVYAAHTNLDVVTKGVNDVLSDLFGIKSRGYIEADGHGYGYGRRGKIEKTTIRALAEKAKSLLGIPSVILYGDPDREVEKIAVMGGSGSSLVDTCVSFGVQCYLTGDVKYHNAMDAVEMGMAVIDIGHYYSEQPVMQTLKSYCTSIDELIPVTIVEQDKKYERLTL